MKNIIFAILIGASFGAQAQPFVTGSKLHEMFQTVEHTDPKSANLSDFTNLTMLSAYLWGIGDTGDNALFCLNGINPSSPQGRAVVMKYLKDNPERWNESGALLVVEAFRKAFPCKR